MTTLHAREELSSFVFPERRKPRGTEHLSPLIHAIKRSLIVEFTYVKFNNSVSRTRSVMPYALKEGRGRWYLLAIEIGENVRHAGEIKSWGLDRIRDLNVTMNRFMRNPAIEPEKEFKDVVSPKGGRYNEAFPLHESQETLVDDGNEFRIRLKVKITYDFKQELLSQSDDLVVIAPEHLRKELCEIYKRAMERNVGDIKLK